MIPPLEAGVLPEGIHECTFEELERAFGQFQRSDRRINLIAKLKAYLDEARNSGLVIAAIIDGSFVTIKDEPEDIDLIVVLKPDVPWDSLRPSGEGKVPAMRTGTACPLRVSVCVESLES